MYLQLYLHAVNSSTIVLHAIYIIMHVCIAMRFSRERFVPYFAHAKFTLTNQRYTRPSVYFYNTCRYSFQENPCPLPYTYMYLKSIM